MSSRGSPSSAWASATRRRIPPESAVMRRLCDLVEADQREDPADLVVARAALGQLLEDGDVVDELERGEARVEARLLRQVARGGAGSPAAAARVGGLEAEEPDLSRVGRAARWRGSAAAWSCPRRWGRAGR